MPENQLGRQYCIINSKKDGRQAPCMQLHLLLVHWLKKFHLMKVQSPHFSAAPFFISVCLSAVLWLIPAALYGQAGGHVVKGIVSSIEDRSPLVGVTVKIKGRATGTVTDAGGNYQITVESDQDTLVFSFVGYLSKAVPVAGAGKINPLLQPAAENLNELVVTGYMRQKKANLTGAISVVPEKELERNQGSTNIMQALQGKVPGLNVTTDGNPTGHVSIEMRGLTSVVGAPPLIVIDGVPAQGLNLRDINGGNIASMQFLKDAASASIYGAQGAGGVILIETKKGQAGNPTVRYSGSVGVAAFLNKVPMMNTQQYGRATWQAAVNGGFDPNTMTQIYDYKWHRDDEGLPVLDEVTPIAWLNDAHTMPSANTNWLDAISQLGIQNNHQITVSGGNKRSTSLLSLNYNENQGTQIHTGYRRFTVRLNTSYDLIKDHLRIGENIEFSRLRINDQNEMHNAMAEPPIVPVHTTDGGWGGSAVNLGMDDYWNPVRILTLNKDNYNKYNKLFGNVFADFHFLRHVTFHTQLGLVYTEGNHRTINFTFMEGGGKSNEINNVDQWYWNEATLDFTNTLDYHNQFGAHNIDVLIGMESNQYTTETTQANRQRLQYENYDYAYLNTATGNMSVTGGGDKYNFLSYFSKVNYVYDDRYLLSASVRYDGSSKFGINNRFGLFPAVSAGWRISEEDFFQSVQRISNLKFRVSWGVNGNSHIPTNAMMTYFLPDYNFTSYSLSGAETGALPSGFYKKLTGNPDLKWETSRQLDIGLDFGLFSQRLTGSADYYHKATNDMLFQPPYLGTIGEGGYQYVNAADMVNNGLELALTYQSNPSKAFTYSISANIAHNHNEISNLPTSVRFAYGGSSLKGDDIQGRPLHSYYGFITDGLFESEEEVENSPVQPGKGLGRIRYKDISGPDGKPDGVIDYDYDQTWIGCWDPDVTFGLTFTANYKQFDFYLFWQGVMGNTVYNGWKTYSDFWNVWVQQGFNHPTRILDAWSPSNPEATIPALSVSNANDELRSSTYFMESGSYLKLRNVQIGYRLPEAIIAPLGIQQFRIYVLALNSINIHKWWGDNAFTGPDPETPEGSDYSNPYVRPQTFKFGVDVTF